MMRAMEEIGQAIKKGREILLTDEKSCRKVNNAAEKAAAVRRRRAGKKSKGASWPKEGGGVDSNLMGEE